MPEPEDTQPDSRFSLWDRLVVPYYSSGLVRYGAPEELTRRRAARTGEFDVAEWLWTVSDTGDGDGVIEPGEAALLFVLNRFEPDATGLSEAGPYTLSGDAAWLAGTVEAYQNLLDQQDMFGDGVLDATTNTISGVHHFQLPPFFNADFDDRNPVPLYAIRWRPDRYYIHTVSIESGAPDAWFYTDVWGNETLYEGAGGLGSFTVVPGPAAPGMVLPAFCSWARRRR